ncbi:MAG: lysostaphin resistance A-like protein [Thermoplasmatota archaeon]
MSLEDPTLGTQEQMKKDPKWNGVPPVGNKPIRNRWRFLWYVLIVFMVKIVIWGIFRYVTGNVYPFTDPGLGDEIGYWVAMIAKPVLQLGPVFLLWWFLFKENGSPFRFTKKNLASSIFWGFVGVILFFIVSTTSMSILMSVLGYGDNFRIVAGWDDPNVGWGLVIAMMFSYMIGTGPAEELFSRGFLQDQTARAFPIWFAMVFSAVLFAAGHLPISILMHKMPAEAIFWYMLVLFVMGMFFSLIYQWSRNIVLPILIHGLWDWYLTLFSWKGDWSSTFLQKSDVLFLKIDFFNTMITLAVMLPIFYFLYKKFWQKDRFASGSPFEPKKSENAFFRWLRDRDQGHWPQRPWIFTITITFLFCLAMIPVAAFVGVDDPSLHEDTVMDPIGEETEVSEQHTILLTEYLAEGGSEQITIPSNSSTITRVNVSLGWEDEPDQGFRYTNTPDIFEIRLMDMENVELDRDRGSSGHISIVWSRTENGTAGNLTVEVNMVSAGDQEPMVNLLGLREVNDEGNEYALRIDYQILTYQKKEGEGSGDVRW